MLDLVPGVVGVARDHGDQASHWGQEQLVHSEDGRSTHLSGTLEQHCAVSLFDGNLFCYDLKSHMLLIHSTTW